MNRASEFLPKVSVIIPIYNGQQDLPALIDCLKAQTYPTEQVEYLLIDNNSHDQTPAILQAATQTLSSMTIRPLRETQIQSSYGARNTGIRAATGEIIAFTDVDCRPQPQWLHTLIQPFTDTKIGIVAGEIVALPSQNLLEKHAEREQTLSQKHTLTHEFCPYGQTANLAIRRLIFQQVGLFRSCLTTGGDADICWRILRQTSYQLYFAETAIVQHRHRATLRQLQQQWHRYGAANQYLHELYGVPLIRQLTTQEYLYRLTRWLFKELPVTGIKFVLKKAALVDLLMTPIGLINVYARTQGQRQAIFPEQARQIEWLEPTSE